MADNMNGAKVAQPEPSDNDELFTSITSRFLFPSQVVDRWGLNMVLYGAPGVGKTTLAATAQDYVPARDVLLIDVEGGARAIADRTDISIFRPIDWTDLGSMLEFLEESSHAFRTIIIDTINECQRLGLEQIMRGGGPTATAQLQDYLKSNEQMLRFVRAYRSLAYTRGWNIIFISHETEVHDQATGAVLTRPALTPKAAEMVVASVDAVGYLYRDGPKRMLTFDGTAYLRAKFRQPQHAISTVPLVPLLIENPTLATILKGTTTNADQS